MTPLQNPSGRSRSRHRASDISGYQRGYYKRRPGSVRARAVGYASVRSSLTIAAQEVCFATLPPQVPPYGGRLQRA